MEFSIVYITYRPGGFDILADSLENQTLKDYELIVVDDYPVDRRGKVRRYLEERGIPVAYVGPSKPKCFPELAANVINAMNTGFLLSTKEVVIILNDYIWLAPDWLEKMANAYLFKGNYCVILGGQMWANEKPRDNQGIISIWERPWQGSPEKNGCQRSFLWMPTGLELSCSAFPWSLLVAINGFPECLDAYMANPLELMIKNIELANGKFYVDQENITQMINHRTWQPPELWHQSKRVPTNSTDYIERENCFNLKIHPRGKAYWVINVSTNELSQAQKAFKLVNGQDGRHLDRIGWTRSNVSLEDTILEVGASENAVWRGTPYRVTKLNPPDSPNISRETTDVIAWGEALPFKDKAFSVVSLCEVLEHVEDPERVLKEAIRVAKEKIVITVPNEFIWPPKLAPFAHPHTHMNNYHYESFLRLVKGTGLLFQVYDLRAGPWAWLGGVVHCKKMENIFDDEGYWCGELGYRPGTDGMGYRDFPIHQVKVDYILRRQPRERVLDCGAAFGYIVKRLRDKGIDAWGIDISQYALSQAPEEVKAYLMHGSIGSLPWPDQSFDMVTSFSTLEHLPPEILPKAISEIKRVAGRGIIAVTPGDDPHFDEDITHQTKEPLSWWRSQFPPEFEVRNDADEEWLKKIPEVHLHRHEWIRRKASLENKILEVGCAENPVWSGTKFNVTTVDNQINPKIQIFPDVLGEAESLPFEDKSFDIVCEGELLEHVPDPQKVLKQAVRVARKKVIITTPFEHEWTPELKPFWNPGHVRFYTPDTLKEELNELNLPSHIEIIRNGPWAWLGAEIYCNREKVVTNEMAKLNLGSFVDVIPGWENIDILPLRQRIPPEIKFKQWDLRRGIPYADNSVDLIRMSHLIEHLTLEEAHNLCSEIFRVLKANGIGRISNPDLDIILRHYRNRGMSFFNQIQPLEYIAAPTEGEKLSRILFSGDYQHKAIYNFEMLKNFLEQAGFETGKIYKVSPGFSYSEVMKAETEDQHIEVSITVEALK